MAKLKINITMWGTERTGGNRAIFEIANRLSDLNHNVIITTLTGDYSWFQLRAKVNCISTLPNKRAFRIFNNIIRTYRKSRRRPEESPVFYMDRLLKMHFGTSLDLIPFIAENIPDCDINIATWYPTAFAVYFSNKGKPYYIVQDFPDLVKEQCKYYEDYCLKMFEASLMMPFYFLTNSKYTQDLVTKCQPYAKSKVVGVGVNEKVFHPQEGKTLLDIHKPKVMIIARGSKQKGDEVAMKTLNSINKKIPIHAIIVGSTSSVQKTFSLVKPDFDYACFGTIDDEKLSALYCSSDLFLYTSYIESFGLPPLEAMACGTAVVSTDCLGNREYAIDGYNCLLAPPGDIEKLTYACHRLLNDSNLKESVIKGGLEVVRHFTWDVVVKRIEESFRDL